MLSHAIPGGIGPESKRAGAALLPSSLAVTVCSVISSFIHETVLPDTTLIAFGAYGSRLPSSGAPGVILTDCWENAMSVELDKIPIVSIMLVIISKFEIKTFTVCAIEVWYIKNYI